MELALKEWLDDNDIQVKSISNFSNRDDWDSFRHEHLQRIKHSAKARKLAFNLTVDDFKYPEFCPILGIKISRSLTRDHSPSLDRVDNSKGYIKDNVRMISYRANRLKANMSVDDIANLLAYAKGQL